MTTEEIQKKKWVTDKELAENLKVSTAWIKRARKFYGLPFYKIEGLIRYDEDEIGAWIQSKRATKKAV